ncbi:MAG: hypothetical protein Q9174_000848 [Haloplaca sp. 1 TL-2023]
MAPGWKLLRLGPSDASIPPLLAKSEFGISDYKLWVTDLTHIWSETLSQRSLIQRAWDIDTDIDPVEADQRQLLLKRIQDSIAGVAGTNLLISNGSTSNDLVIHAHSPLPKPLKPLHWPFRLALASQISLTNELILPLLAEQFSADERVSSLLTQIRDKDHVIGKLVDHMEAGGIELGKVFPNASSKRNRTISSREGVGRYVQGLGSFDENQWRAQGSPDRAEPHSYKRLLSEMPNKAEGLASGKLTNHVDPGSWWESLGESQSGKSVDISQAPPTSPSQSPPVDDFQRQPTPEHLKRHTVGKNGSPDKITLPRREINHKAKPTIEKAEESGTDLIDKESETDDDDLDSMQPTARERQLPTKQEHSSKSTSPAPRSNSPEALKAKPKGTLGRIGGGGGGGGGGKQSVSPHKSSLGHIGAAKKTVEPVKRASESPEPPRGRESTAHKSPSPTKETSQERADKKREMLKRQLEEKSRVGVKKKRKF